MVKKRLRTCLHRILHPHQTYISARESRRKIALHRHRVQQRLIFLNEAYKHWKYLHFNAEKDAMKAIDIAITEGEALEMSCRDLEKAYEQEGKMMEKKMRKIIDAAMLLLAAFQAYKRKIEKIDILEELREACLEAQETRGKSTSGYGFKSRTHSLRDC